MIDVIRIFDELRQRAGWVIIVIVSNLTVRVLIKIDPISD
jgi:hypothetical protein